jgi:hypothetical protein
MKTLKYAHRCVPAEDDHNQSSTAYPAAQWLTGSVATRLWIICVLSISLGRFGWLWRSRPRAGWKLSIDAAVLRAETCRRIALAANAACLVVEATGNQSYLHPP